MSNREDSNEHWPKNGLTVTEIVNITSSKNDCKLSCKYISVSGEANGI